MDYVKRKHQSLEEKSKKLRNEFVRSITSIENLSNELFFEIFDYLDGHVIYIAFSNLNHRFQQLLNSSSHLFKIIPDHSISHEILMNNYKQMILLHRQQIFSINLWMPLHINEFFSSFTIDSSFINLESLAINQLEPDVLMSVLSNLSCLPRLFSLTIKMIDDLKDLTDVYRIILTLPKLKYYKFTTCYLDASISLTMPSDKQFSTIEYLSLHHSYTFNELSTILSYTPQLRHLNLLHTIEMDPSFGTILPMTLLNLTCVFFHFNQVTFDQIEAFISKMCCKLKVLTLTIQSEDLTFLDADRWEKIIGQYLPQLEKFYFQYYVYLDDDKYESPIYSRGSNQFNSTFWIERRWIFETKLEGEHYLYSVSPYRKRWYEDDRQYNVINSSLELSKSSQLIVSYIPDDECYELVIMDITSALNVTQFYHLEITELNIFTGILIQIIDSLRQLITLSINTLLMKPPEKLRDKELLTLDSVKEKSKIVKVYLAEMIDIEEVYFLMKLCPYMEYLKVDYVHNMEIEAFLRDIFKKINNDCNHYLRLLCFKLPEANNEMIKKLEEMINIEQLLVHFTIQRVLDDIYVQWKWLS